MVNVFSFLKGKKDSKTLSERNRLILLDSHSKIKDESYSRLIQDYDLKLRLIKEFQTNWSISPEKISKEKLKEIPKLNRSIITNLQKLVLDINEDSEIINSYFFKISKKAFEKNLASSGMKTQQVDINILKGIIKRINESLDVLLQVLKQENEYLKKNTDWNTYRDIVEHGAFYALLSTELTKEGVLKKDIFTILHYSRYAINKIGTEIKVLKEINGAEIIEIKHPSSIFIKHVFKAYTFKIFDPAEVDPLEGMRDEVDETFRGDAEFPVIFLGIFKEGKCFGGIYGNIFRIPGYSATFGAIGLNGVEENMRKNNEGKSNYFGKALYDTIEEEMKKLSPNLHFIVLEANMPPQGETKLEKISDATFFWHRIGFKTPKGSIYYQPSMTFGEDGTALEEKILLKHMLKMMHGETDIDLKILKSATKLMLTEWYYPGEDELKKRALAKARGHVNEIINIFDNSLEIKPNKHVDLVSVY